MWFLILLSLSFATCLGLFSLSGATTAVKNSKKSGLPPGPLAVPILGNLIWLRRSFRIQDLEILLRKLHARYGPIVTLRLGSHPAIFISDRALTHRALVELGATFADRPAPIPATGFISANQHDVNSAAYGPLWRLLRRNLNSEILHPSRLKLYAGERAWVLDVLTRHLQSQGDSTHDGAVVAMESFQFAMFCLLVLMCFGEKLDEEAIKNIEIAQRSLLLYASKLNVLRILPSISRYIFKDRLQAAMKMQQRQAELFVSLIRARKERRSKQRQQQWKDDRFVYSYADSLLDTELPEEGGRKLTEEEMVVLCSEFLSAGTETTATALQWIMANLVKHKDVQAKLAEELDSTVGCGSTQVLKEEDLQKVPYLKAVIMEVLRRHPPLHYVLPHAVMGETTFEGYVIPKNASVNFLVSEVGWDEKVWKEPMEFRPERFLGGGPGEGVDISSSRENKMMPFGVGRRICPGLGMAMLHLEYFVANLVNRFEWKPLDGEDVDLSEKPEFTVVMKNPLRARLVPRRKA